SRSFLILKTVSKIREKNFEKKPQISCIRYVILVSYYGAVNKTALAMIQEVATRSVALPRDRCWFS
ncbi:hypothetical protein, partial [Streptococcus pluranimalium]|uniref:hypothetical protein n=1 Tax=Streptococcus pluranimalium TaxID=82348 RepID=UPI0039FCDC48